MSSFLMLLKLFLGHLNNSGVTKTAEHKLNFSS